MKKIYIIIIAIITLLLGACTGGKSHIVSSQVSDISSVQNIKQPIWKIENYDINKTNTNIYFFRNKSVYKFNKEKDTVDFFADLPKTNVGNFSIDINEEFMYYTDHEYVNGFEDSYSFKKMNLKTKEITVIDSDLFTMGGFLYDNKIYFYSDGYIMHYDIANNSFVKYETTYDIDGNGHIEIYDGSIYFSSCKLHQISINDCGTKIFAQKSINYFLGYFYNDSLYYVDYEDIDKVILVRQNISSGEKTILDNYTVHTKEYDDQVILEESPYLLIEGDTIYYSYNNETYKIKTNGESKEKIADFAIKGQMFINNNKIYWQYAEGQDFGIGGPIERDKYRLYSFELKTKEKKEILFLSNK